MRAIWRAVAGCRAGMHAYACIAWRRWAARLGVPALKCVASHWRHCCMSYATRSLRVMCCVPWCCVRVICVQRCAAGCAVCWRCRRCRSKAEPSARSLVCARRTVAHICAGTGLAPAHICAGTGLTPATSAPGLGSPLPRLRRDWVSYPRMPYRMPHATVCVSCRCKVAWLRLCRLSPPHVHGGFGPPCKSHASMCRAARAVRGRAGGRRGVRAARLAG
jgi:hypothetical protein